MYILEYIQLFSIDFKKFKTLATAVLLSGAFGAVPAYAVDSDAQSANFPTIKITATGRANIKPDMAVLSLAVVREAKSAREALSSNNSAMNAVLLTLVEAGIGEKDLQTANFNIQPRYNSPKSSSKKSQRPQIIGYRVSNALTVKVRDMAILGTVLDQAVTLGVNSGGNIQFTNQDPSLAITRARQAAMQNAMAKAQTLVTAAGASLGEIVSISEWAEAGGAPVARMAQAAFKSRDIVPVASGENTYTVTIEASWRINQH